MLDAGPPWSPARAGASSPDPARLEVGVGERVRWRAMGGQRIRLEIDAHPGRDEHEVVARQGEILAIFLTPGEHRYQATLASYGQKLWMSERGDVPFWGVVSSNPKDPGATRGERYATCAGAYHCEDGAEGRRVARDDA